MSFVGRLFTYEEDYRATRALVTAEYAKVHIKVIPTTLGEKSDEFYKSGLFTKGTFIPAFYDDKAKLAVIESAGIPFHIAKLYDTTNQLLGKTKLDESAIAQWILYVDTNIWPNIFSLLDMYQAYTPFNKKAESEVFEKIKKTLIFLDKQLLQSTYLGSEYVALSDIVATSSFYWLFTSYLTEVDRKEIPNVTRWFNTIVNQPEFKKVVKETVLCNKRVAPLKEVPVINAKSKKESSKKEGKPAKKEVAKKEEPIPEPAKEVKKKHPCEELPTTTLNLDEWKRVYSNNDTRPTAIEWFWKNFDKSGYSVWHVQYRYNDELTLTFMSSNLVGGFFQRIERSRKYAFGSVLILGENNKNEIEGFFVFRGQDMLPEIEDAADFPSYKFTKIDVFDPKYKTKFEDYLAWDGALDGKKFSDGKIFK